MNADNLHETLYDQDFYAWSQEQARLLRSGRLAAADVAHIAEELESIGRGKKRELIGRLALLLAHLLKWQHQPALRGNSWRLTIQEQRRKLARHLEDNPSLRSQLDAAITDAYGDALLQAQRETGLAEAEFPAGCPFRQAEIFSEKLLPGSNEV
jgi:Domain of unknown function DUF29